MGFTLRKSFKLPIGRINLSSRGGIGLSFGVRGLRVGIGSGRAPRITGGTGPVRYYKTIGGVRTSAHQDEPGLPTSRGVPSCVGVVICCLLAVIALGATGIVIFRAHSEQQQPYSAQSDPEPLRATITNWPGMDGSPAAAPVQSPVVAQTQAYTPPAPQLVESPAVDPFAPAPAAPDYSSASPSGTHVGPRGGVYHYSASGKKVYEKHR
jgi:hypothetical protein